MCKQTATNVKATVSHVRFSWTRCGFLSFHLQIASAGQVVTTTLSIAHEDQFSARLATSKIPSKRRLKAFGFIKVEIKPPTQYCSAFTNCAGCQKQTAEADTCPNGPRKGERETGLHSRPRLRKAEFWKVYYTQLEGNKREEI